MNTRTRQKRLSAPKLAGMCVLLPFLMALLNVAHANALTDGNTIAGVIDSPLDVNKTPNANALKQQIRKEQRELAKLERTELKERAKKGERLAQVALGADLADEAQQILFAPAAANTAISEALAWYSLAAKRGFPGSPSLNSSGVKFHPVRVVRNK